MTISAGQCLYIPAGMPHKSLPIAHDETRFLNIYLDLDGFGIEPTVFELSAILETAQDVTSALPRIVACLRSARRQSRDSAGRRASGGILSGREPLASWLPATGYAVKGLAASLPARSAFQPAATAWSAA